MCRLFGLVANKPVRSTFSMHEAPNALRVQGRYNPDGWGVGYYENEQPMVRKYPVAAENDPNFGCVVENALSHMFVAHVRYATTENGKKDEHHTHPFQRNGWMLAQNGGIGSPWHKRIKQEVVGNNIRGQTSGEHLLAWLYHRAGHLQDDEQRQAILLALKELVSASERITSANFVLVTGDYLYAFRFAQKYKDRYSLFYLERFPDRYEITSSKTGMMIQAKEARAEQAVLIASEKLTGEEENWKPLRNGSLLIVNRMLNTYIEDIC